MREAAEISGLQALIVQRDGEILIEEYFEGASADRLFHLRSATKSVTAILVGIAIDQGLLTSVDKTVGEILGPRVETFGADKAALTVRHLLTMTAGLRWNELGNVDEYNNFRTSRDPLGRYLGRAFVAEPGETWAYSSGASHVLSVILSEVTGTTARDYARRVLFQPLEIDRFAWASHNDGHTEGAAGLELPARGSLKIAELVDGGGSWSGRRIVSEAWIDEMTRPQVALGGGGHYGYQWWIDGTGPFAIVAAQGFAGQSIGVAPAKHAMVVTHCRWRGLDRPSAEQSNEVGAFVRERVAPFLVPEYFSENR